jgi:hypothetical protein
MIEEKMNLLASVLTEKAVLHNGKLEELKQVHDDLVRPDFLWHYLLQSFSTMGRSAGWHGLIGNKENYNRVTYEAIEAVAMEGRGAHVEEVCRAAQIRMPGRKAEFIVKCFDQVRALGGLEAAKATLLQLQGREDKIAFLMQFHGIGKKYARNMMMDVYHEDFRDSIAIDVRIQAISKVLNLEFDSYEDEEDFYLGAGRIAGLNGWEVDRLLYNFRSDFESELKASSASIAEQI